MMGIAKRHIAFLGFLLIGGCDADYTPVKAFHQNLPIPTRVAAELLSDNRVDVTWDVTDPAGVVQGFVVSIEDTTASLYEKLVPGAATRGFTTDFELQDVVPSTPEDSVWYFVRVRSTDATLFQGPPSEPDSILLAQ